MCGSCLEDLWETIWSKNGVAYDALLMSELFVLICLHKFPTNPVLGWLENSYSIYLSAEVKILCAASRRSVYTSDSVADTLVTCTWSHIQVVSTILQDDQHCESFYQSWTFWWLESQTLLCAKHDTLLACQHSLELCKVRSHWMLKLEKAMTPSEFNRFVNQG